MRRLLAVLGLAALVAVLVVGLVQAGGGETSKAPAPRFDPAQARRTLAQAPPELRSLYGDQASRILGGGRRAFAARLRTLRGHPVVVNKWASWCPPCRFEFPFFQRQAVARGRTVAFVGLNSGDHVSPARDFLREFPLPYPSYEDPDERIARTLSAGRNYPVTIFLDRRGKVAFMHQGGYRSEQDLAADIERYLQ